MILSNGTIQAMIEGMRRIKRTPERHWLEPIIQRLELLQPGDQLTIARLDLVRGKTDESR
jgi:hypothetical protein